MVDGWNERREGWNGMEWNGMEWNGMEGKGGSCIAGVGSGALFGGRLCAEGHAW
jgi:hypothetical protein